jgi:hypothetical protein
MASMQESDHWISSGQGPGLSWQTTETHGNTGKLCDLE